MLDPIHAHLQPLMPENLELLSHSLPGIAFCDRAMIGHGEGSQRMAYVGLSPFKTISMTTTIPQ